MGRSSDAPGTATYSVGYGKPPAASQFRKGQSGNPQGSSRKRRASKADENSSIFDAIMLEEAGRKIQITEHGVRSQITTHEAAARKLSIGAVKGERGAQKEYFDRVQAAQERQHRDKMARFGLLAQYVKEQGDAGVASSAPGTTQVWPHPDDVHIDYQDCIGEAIGPIDARQALPFLALAAEYRA